MLWENNEQKLRPVPILEALLSPTVSPFITVDHGLWAGGAGQWPEEWYACLKAIKLLGKVAPGPELESKEWTRHAGVGVSGGCRNGRTFSLEGGIQPDSEGDAVLLWGERMSPGFTLTVMNEVTEREEIHQISSKWIADLYESWREESKSCLRRSHVQSSVLSLTIWVSFLNLWGFSSFILLSPQVCGSKLVKMCVYIATVLATSTDLDSLGHVGVASVTQTSAEDCIAGVFNVCSMMCTCWN